MTLVMILATICAGYIFVGSIYGGYLSRKWSEACSFSTEECCHPIGAFFFGILWPLTIFMLGGIEASRIFKTPNEREIAQKTKDNAQNKRIEELEEENRKLDRLLTAGRI